MQIFNKIRALLLFSEKLKSDATQLNAAAVADSDALISRILSAYLSDFFLSTLKR